MIRRDLAAARVPYTVDRPDGPLHADFHALRHCYVTLLGRGGVDLRTAQELAGHRTPTLTARIGGCTIWPGPWTNSPG